MMQTFEEVKTGLDFSELALEKALSTVIPIIARPCRPTLSPSGLGCKRAAAFKLSGATGKDDEETYESGLAAGMGSFIHGRIQKFLSASDIWIDVTDFIKSHPELNLEVNPVQKHDGEISLLFSGRRGDLEVPPFSFQCDGIVCIDGKYYLVEIKTETEMAWQKRTAPNPKHAMQGRGYSFLYGIADILWLYTSRESFGTHRKIYLQHIQKSETDSFVSDCIEIGSAVKDGDIGRLEKAKDCRYCGFTELCKKLD